MTCTADHEGPIDCTNEHGETERRCPSGHAWTQADHVDNGVGMERCGPYHCKPCGWIEPDDPLRGILEC